MTIHVPIGHCTDPKDGAGHIEVSPSGPDTSITMVPHRNGHDLAVINDTNRYRLIAALLDPNPVQIQRTVYWVGGHPEPVELQDLDRILAKYHDNTASVKQIQLPVEPVNEFFDPHTVTDWTITKDADGEIDIKAKYDGSHLCHAALSKKAALKLAACLIREALRG